MQDFAVRQSFLQQSDSIGGDQRTSRIHLLQLFQLRDLFRPGVGDERVGHVQHLQIGEHLQHIERAVAEPDVRRSVPESAGFDVRVRGVREVKLGDRPARLALHLAAERFDRLISN